MLDVERVTRTPTARIRRVQGAHAVVCRLRGTTGGRGVEGGNRYMYDDAWRNNHTYKPPSHQALRPGRATKRPATAIVTLSASGLCFGIHPLPLRMMPLFG